MVITSTVSAQIQVFPPQEVKEVTFEVALNQVISMYPNRDSVDFYKLDSNITWDTAHVNLPNKVSLPPMFNL